MSRSKKKDYPKKFDSRRFDWSCRNHGSCSYCKDNRTFFDKAARVKADIKEQEEDYIVDITPPDITDVLLGLDLE